MQSFPRKIRVCIATQTLTLLETEGETPGETHSETPGNPTSAQPNQPSKTPEQLLAVYTISTSGHGIGTEPGSHKTPTGHFRIAEKIGHNAPLGTIFKARVPTGKVAEHQCPGDPSDAITTRILWLEGTEPHNANTKERYIYIHGTNHEETIGQPCSHGCVRMRNADIAALFDQVSAGTHVEITAP